VGPSGADDPPDSPVDGPRLPRDLESDPRVADVRAALRADLRALWSRGTLAVAVIPLTPTLRTALATLATQGRLERGLETAEATLAAEQRGLQALPPEVAARQRPRISRVLMVTNDGAERFYRGVERLAMTHAPRVLVCLIDCPSPTLGELLYGPNAVVKLVLTAHKTAATSLLRALADD
jgi:hypothetical protein